MDNFFGTGSKSSLHETIRSQQERLAKYEKKLGDLVRAYKTIQDEKRALEETVNAFSSQPQFQPGDHLQGDLDNGGSDADSASGGGAGEDGLRQKIATLTRALASLNETKNTVESRYHHDKRELLDHIEKLKSSITAEKEAAARGRADHEQNIKEIKSKLRKEQHEREQEQTHHVAMLRELQHMLAAERNATQKSELELDELRHCKNYDKQREVYDEKVKLLAEEKEYLCAEVERLRVSAREPSKRHLAIEEQLEELRAVQVQAEEGKSERESTAYQQLHLQTSADQSRIHHLETRLTELVELIANYDLRQKRDQDKISRLQQRVTSLESEVPPPPTVNVSVNTNVVIVPDTSPTPPPPESPVTPTSPNIPGEGLQLVRKSREAEIGKLRDSLRILKFEMTKMQDEKKGQHNSLLSLTEKNKHELNQLAVEHAQEISEQEKGHSLRLSELLESTTKSRARSQELLKDRDNEIAELKSRLFTKEKSSTSDESVVGELLMKVEGENVPRTLVFYKQQHKYIVDELAKVKKFRDTLEVSLREKERNEHLYVGEINLLKQENRRLIRNTSRESANLEYIKNIVLRYLKAANGSEKRQILQAIFTVLEFSEKEKHPLKHKLVAGWFG